MGVDAYREAVRLMRARDWRGALRQLDIALAARPGMPQWEFTRAQCLMALGQREAACATAMRLLREPTTDAVLIDAVGSFFSFAGDQHSALAAFERAVAMAPDNAHFLFNRATVHRFLGRLEDAEADYDRAIARRPADYEAYKNRSDLRTQSVARNHVAELESLLAGGIADWRGEVQVRYALAKEYEDLGEHIQAFDHLRWGARKRRENLEYRIATDLETVEWIIDAFARAPATALLGTGRGANDLQPDDDALHEAPVQGARSQGARMHRARMQGGPIFIVGLPRSGTTLVDRILSSHSTVTSAGELNEFALALVARVSLQNGGARLPRRELVACSAHIDFEALGEEYLTRARAVGGPGLFIDKMPLNYLYCGIIRRALPEAKIVHLARHPMAACYAIFKTLFKDGYPFSYDLEEIGLYYIAYRRLMQHWDTAMPGLIHHVEYEKLVADQTGETRRLLSFCDLAWEDACLDFHRNAAPATTASASQIRRPLYDSSVAQWRHYATQLAGLRAQLIAAGIDA